MQNTKFFLLQKGDEITVSNTETNSENAFCDNKMELFEIVIGLLGQKKMTEENANSLVKEIMSDKVALPFLPTQVIRTGILELFDNVIIAKIMEGIPLIKENKADIKSETVSFKVCSSCKMHGRFMGRGMLSSKFSLKETAIEALGTMYNDGLITLTEKQKLFDEVMNSVIPQDPTLN